MENLLDDIEALKGRESGSQLIFINQLMVILTPLSFESVDVRLWFKHRFHLYNKVFSGSMKG